MADYVETFRGVVYPWHCDHLGHMNVQHYVGMFDQALGHLLLRLGLRLKRDGEPKRAFVDVKHIVEYKRELRVGSMVWIESAPLEVGNKSLRCMNRMFNAETGEISATSEMIAVHFDLQARKAVPIPDEMRTRIQESIVERREGD
jgi:acyl-CoA thioester hydrolase